MANETLNVWSYIVRTLTSLASVGFGAALAYVIDIRRTTARAAERRKNVRNALAAELSANAGLFFKNDLLSSDRRLKDSLGSQILALPAKFEPETTCYVSLAPELAGMIRRCQRAWPFFYYRLKETLDSWSADALPFAKEYGRAEDVSGDHIAVVGERLEREIKELRTNSEMLA